MTGMPPEKVSVMIEVGQADRQLEGHVAGKITNPRMTSMSGVAMSVAVGLKHWAVGKWPRINGVQPQNIEPVWFAPAVEE